MVIDVIVLIGMMDNRMKEFIKNHKFHDKIVVAYKICNIKHLTCDIDVIIPFGYLLENGLISNTYIHLYELLLSTFTQYLHSQLIGFLGFIQY